MTTEPRDRRPRTTEYGLTFTGPCATIPGWAFPVPECFAETLDIRFLLYALVRKDTRRGIPGIKVHRWSQGLPPQYTFSAGDVFYDPPEVRGLIWRDALRCLRRALRITDAVPDDVDGEAVTFGWAAFTLDDFRDGEVVTRQQVRLSQHGLVAFLRTGDLAAAQALRPATLLPRPVPEPGLFRLRYPDVHGTMTEQTVAARSVFMHGGHMYLSGTCRELQLARTYRGDRIVELVDLSTGEVPDSPADWLAALAAAPA